MRDPAVRPEPSLPELLASRARAATDGRLVVDVLAGALFALALAVWRPVGWVSLAGLALALCAFGAWGIADRELGERTARARPASIRLLRSARATAAAVGYLCAVGALFAALGTLLGTWIS